MASPDPPSNAAQERRQDVQPADSDVRPSRDPLLRELDRAGGLTEGQKLERLVERDIILQLQLQNFDPECDDWIEFAGALIEYGYAVLMGWAMTGTLRTVAARTGGGQGVRGLSAIPDGLRLTQDEAHDLVMEVIVEALELFRVRTLAEHRWSPTGGASLRTFFIGRCLMTLPNVYKRTRQRRHDTLGPEHANLVDGRARNPAMTVTTNATLDDVFNRDGRTPTSSEVRAMFEAQEQGWSLAEIATVLTDAGFPNTEATVRTKMSRARADARRRFGTDG